LKSKRSKLLLLPLSLAFGGVVATGGSACDARVVDVGANDSATGVATASSLDGGVVKSSYGCAEWIDDELYALRDGGCGGACESTPADPYMLESKQSLIAASAGQWLYCEGSLGPEGAIGVEFAPGCRLYFLRRDLDGTIVRGTEKAFQAEYDIYDPRPEGTPRRIDIHVDPETTLTFDVVAYRCPEHLRLLAPGKRLELAPGYEEQGRPDPTR
jgi:hypothetical protein